MEQTNTTPAMQMDVDWSGEVRYPDVPAQQQAAAQQTPPPAAAVQQPSGETQISVTPVPTQTTPVIQAVQNPSPYYHLSYDELRGDDFPVAQRDALDMENPVSQEDMANPVNNSEVYQASMKGLLSRNLGYYVVATFQMGGQGTVTVPGFLYTVGNDYIVLYQPDKGRFVTGDLYALKFVDFHQTQSLPQNYKP